LGLSVTRLIRISFGPFQLGDLPTNAVREVPPRTLREQLGTRLAAEARADLAPRPEPPPRVRSRRTAAAPAGAGAAPTPSASPQPRRTAAGNMDPKRLRRGDAQDGL